MSQSSTTIKSDAQEAVVAKDVNGTNGNEDGNGKNGDVNGDDAYVPDEEKPPAAVKAQPAPPSESSFEASRLTETSSSTWR